MELALGFFSMLGGGLSSAATAVGLTAAEAAAAGASATAAGASAASAASWAAGTSVAAAGSTTLSLLQGALTAGSVLTSLAGGVIANNEADMQASATALQSREQALRIREEELQKIGAARVGFAASGVTLGSGAAIENQIEGDSAFERGLARRTGDIAARQIRLRGRGSLVQAAGDALGSVASTAIDLRRRG